jgi:anion-transporting  ArsA/GET3 family ATPase
LVCAGSGGVGKTTIASAIGLRASQLGLRVLVLTVDPARRLATALGLDLSDDQDRKVPLKNSTGSMSAAVIDSKKVFDGFIMRHSQRSEVAERIMQNRLYKEMSTTLAGSQEFTSLERLLQAVESELYDLVILDTPPTKHAMDFLTAPQRINSLFQDAITKWFMIPIDKPKGFIAGLVGRGTKTVLKSLEVLTGGPFIDELIDFFSAVRSVQQVLRERSQAAEALLMSPRTQFIVVTSFDAAKLLEANYLQSQLKSMKYRLKAVVINRAFPNWLPGEMQTRASESDAKLVTAGERVREFYSQFRDFYAARFGQYDLFSKTLGDDVLLIRIPEYQQDIHGLEDLELLAGVLAGAIAGPAI